MAADKPRAVERRELGIGLLGCGFMGKCHTNAYKKIPYIYPAAGIMPRLLVLCDQNTAIVEREAARYGYEECCTDWSQMAADPRIEVFDNCGPDPVHPDPCIAALKQGKHVVCEKPMAVSLEKARQMRDAAAAASGKAMCTFNYRFMPAVRFAKDLIGEGKLGTVYEIRVQYLQMAGHDPALPPERVWCSAWPHSGGLQGIGSHAIDQCRFLVGEIAGVSALVRTFNKDRAIPSAGCPADVTADEATAAFLEFTSGAIGVLESSVVATGERTSSPGRSTAPPARSAGTWSIPTASSPAWAARATIRSWASRKSRSPRAAIRTSPRGGRRATTSAGSTATSSRNSTSSTPWRTASRSPPSKPRSRTATAWP